MMRRWVVERRDMSDSTAGIMLSSPQRQNLSLDTARDESASSGCGLRSATAATLLVLLFSISSTIYVRG